MLTTLTSKGQVTLPKKFRDYLGLRPGAMVDFSLGPHGEVTVRAAEAAYQTRNKDRLTHLRGTLETGLDTKALMSLLRDYDADADDPGLK